MESGSKLAACLCTGLIGYSTLVLAESTVRAATEQSGAVNFKKHCESCHPYGGNALRPIKNLSRTVRERNGIKTANDIVKLMRKPGEDMPAFNEKKLSEKDARNIAEYVVKTFK